MSLIHHNDLAGKGKQPHHIELHRHDSLQKLVHRSRPERSQKRTMVRVDPTVRCQGPLLTRLRTNLPCRIGLDPLRHGLRRLQPGRAVKQQRPLGSCQSLPTEIKYLFHVTVGRCTGRKRVKKPPRIRRMPENRRCVKSRFCTILRRRCRHHHDARPVLGYQVRQLACDACHKATLAMTRRRVRRPSKARTQQVRLLHQKRSRGAGNLPVSIQFRRSSSPPLPPQPGPDPFLDTGQPVRHDHQPRQDNSRSRRHLPCRNHLRPGDSAYLIEVDPPLLLPASRSHTRVTHDRTPRVLVIDHRMESTAVPAEQLGHGMTELSLRTPL
ncbi:hypothetical protein EDD98_4919 [Streptomyces sp. PanSC19]|nr:hypothetical protein EDD98_4919 [Streptomyces sp. PanSC19]